MKDEDDEYKKIEEEDRTRFCPVIKENCKGFRCMFYTRLHIGENKFYYECAYIHAYCNLGIISP